MRLTPFGVTGSIIEIFPTMFMASLLARTSHTDDLWLALVGQSDVAARICEHILPYQGLIDEVEEMPRWARHDLRTAAISAIAADWVRSSTTRYVV
jgi:hypothetical protein